MTEQQPRAEVADVFRAHWAKYCQVRGASVTPLQHRVASAIMACRTAKLGGHVLQCSSCGHLEQSYNSCRNRHCPKCQGHKAQEWVEDRSAELLPVPYFHTVFTLPHQMNELLLVNKRLMCDLLFKAVSATLLKLGENNLSCRLGFFCLLHTWGQTLTLHPHLHVVIPGVGLSLGGDKVVPLKKKRYFLPDKILSSVFRGKFVELLKRAYKQGKLYGEFDDFNAFIKRAISSKWVVRTKPPFGGPQVVLKYLARYTHRVAIGNSRILSVTADSVTFRYKDYRTAESGKQMTLSQQEFIRRFLLHLLPSGFVRVRYYGFLTRGRKLKALEQIRQQLGSCKDIVTLPSNPHSRTCSSCGCMTLLRIYDIPPILSSVHRATAPPFLAITNTIY